MLSLKHSTAIDIWLNAYCRDFRNWTPYIGPAVYDEALRNKMCQYECPLHFRIDFTAQGSEVFVPVAYRSLTGDHLFASPAWERLPEDNSIHELSPERLLELASGYASDSLKRLFTGTFAAVVPAVPAVGTSGWYRPGALAARQDNTPLIVSLFASASGTLMSEEQLHRWFALYIRHVLPLLVPQAGAAAYTFPLIEVHIDAEGFPDKCRCTKGRDAGDSWMHHILSCFMPLVAAMGRHGLSSERSLLKALYISFQNYAVGDMEEPLRQLLSQRNILRKGRLFASENYTVTYPNPLQEYFLAEPILIPNGRQPVFQRYFPKEELTVSIRPFDHEQDMERVYEWFHAEHAKPIWKMDWPMAQLELFYRTITANETAHSFIGEINGEPTFNLEVYWATRDLLGEYYDVQPGDYGTHLLIAPTDKRKKFPSATMQTILDWLFAEPLVDRLVGEGSVESVAALMNKVHVGFRLDQILDMPHKRSHLNFCRREWYWERFPENRNFISTEQTHKNFST